MVSKLGYQHNDVSIMFMNTRTIRWPILMLVIMDSISKNLTRLRVLHIRPRRLKLGPF